jgi:hypothetical protein
VLLLVGCSSRPPRAKTNGGGAVAPDAGTAAAPGDGGSAGVTEAECMAVVDHVLAVMLEDLKAHKPEDEWPTDDQVADKRAVLADEFIPQCLQLDRAVIDCMLKAADPNALAECATVE